EAGLLLALDERHEHALTLVGRAVDDDRVRPEDVDVDRRRPAHRGARLRDRLHHQGRFGNAETGAPILLGHGDSEPAVLRQRLIEIFRELSRFVAVEPVVEVEALAEAVDRIANLLLLFRQGEVHPDLPGRWCGGASRRSRRGWPHYNERFDIGVDTRNIAICCDGAWLRTIVIPDGGPRRPIMRASAKLGWPAEATWEEQYREVLDLLVGDGARRSRGRPRNRRRRRPRHCARESDVASLGLGQLARGDARVRAYGQVHRREDRREFRDQDSFRRN